MDWSNPDFFWKNLSKFLHSQRPEGGTDNLALGVGGDVWKYIIRRMPAEITYMIWIWIYESLNLQLITINLKKRACESNESLLEMANPQICANPTPTTIFNWDPRNVYMGMCSMFGN